MREAKIIAEFLNYKGYLGVPYLSKLLNVSERTILNDIKLLNQSGKRHGYTISNVRGKGYYLDITNEQAFSQYESGLKKQKINYKTDRIPQIISILLLHHDYISQELIADTLNVSKSIIKNDMDLVSQRLLEKSVHLDRKAHFGIRLPLDNYSRKQGILFFYEQAIDFITSAIDSVVGVEFKEIEKLLISLLEKNDLSINYAEMKKIDSMIKICMYTSTYALNQGTETPLQSNIYTQIADTLNTAIQKLYAISLPETDRNDLALFIKQKTKKNLGKIKYAEGLEDRVESFFQKCDAEYNTQFNHDSEFKLSILSHVSLLLDRLHQSISLSNPLVDEIRVKYPVNFNIAIQFVQELEKAYHVTITQDEIGFIATHFTAHMEREARALLGSFNRIAIVCSTGGGSSFLIKLKLESLFIGKDIRTFSLLEEEDLSEYHPDVIFTISDLYGQYDVPIIKIHELLDDNDILKIKNMFNLGQQNVIENASKLVSLMRKDCFHIIDTEMEYEDILKMMAQNLETLGFAGDGYEENILLRESYVSTIYKHGIAIPHPLNNCAKENVISIGIVRSKPKTEKSPRVIFLVNLLTDNINLLNELTRILFDVMESEESVRYLNEAASFEDFTMRIHTLNR